MNDETTRSEEDLTRDGDLADWQAFCIAYYEPIQRALRLLRVPESDVEDQAHAFLLKAADRDFLKVFRAHKDREGQAGRRARFRSYLYKSLYHHVIDSGRPRRTRSPRPTFGVEPIEFVPSPEVPSLDPDALYALDVLYQAIQALRRHCERIGKPHLWTIFEETHLASEFRGRPGKSRAELLVEFPGGDSSFLDNSLTTAKRAFRRIILDVIPLGLRDATTPSERFGEWMEILGRSNASQFDLLQLAYRVAPLMPVDACQANSSELVVDGRGPRAWVFLDEEIRVPSSDELGILLSFRMELPLTEMLDGAELRRYIPPSSEFWPSSRERTSSTPNRLASRPVRPICLMTLLDPTPAENAALDRIDVPGLLGRLKSHVKQLYRRTDHAVPTIFAPLFLHDFQRPGPDAVWGVPCIRSTRPISSATSTGSSSKTGSTTGSDPSSSPGSPSGGHPRRRDRPEIIERSPRFPGADRAPRGAAKRGLTYLRRYDPLLSARSEPRPRTDLAVEATLEEDTASRSHRARPSRWLTSRYVGPPHRLQGAWTLIADVAAHDGGAFEGGRHERGEELAALRGTRAGAGGAARDGGSKQPHGGRRIATGAWKSPPKQDGR